MEGFALLNRAGVGNKRVFLAMTVAPIVGTLSLFWIYFHVAYSLGERTHVQGFASVTYRRLANWISYPSSDIDFVGSQRIGVGVRFGFPDSDAAAIYLIAVACSSICGCEQSRHQRLLVFDTRRFPGEADIDSIRWHRAISSSVPSLPGTNLRRVHHRQPLANNW